MKTLPYILPNTLSLLTTYYCTAACKNCCFECNQECRGRMSLNQIKTYISECIQTFPTVRLVVFSGGECFSLKDDLYKAVDFAHQNELTTRVVTNGYWAVSYEKAYETLKMLKKMGLDELNISTGDDHQKWVPFNNVVNAIKSAVELDLPCLVNIETNPNSHFSEQDFRDREDLKEFIQNDKVILSSGIWIPFDKEDKNKRDVNYAELIKHGYVQRPILSHGCNSLFESIPIDVDGNVYACCGLACRKIKFLKIGNVNNDGLGEIYRRQFDDFLKIWAYVDGPKYILSKIAMETEMNIDVNADMHNCEACLLLLNDSSKIEYIRKNISRYIPDVALKYNIKQKKVSYEK